MQTRPIASERLVGQYQIPFSQSLLLSRLALTLHNSNGIPPSYGEYAIPVDQYTCATVNKLSNTGQSHMGDPVCGDGPAQFSLPSLACGSSADSQGTLYFRRNADNNNILDVATDENYANLVGSCQKAPDCGNYGAPNADSESCTSTDSWTAEFLCTPVLGSNC